MTLIRNNWTKQEIESIYNKPVLELIYDAATVHRQFHEASEVQVCTLLSVKTGGCPEDCAYCPQAARYHTEVKVQKLMEVEEVIGKALEAKEAGSTRFCMGAAWREVRDNRDFDKVLEMVKGVSTMGMEVCCTLGMLSPEQAQKLKDAGLYAYNHNLDTSEEFYNDIITTRNYGDRLETLENVRSAKISVCSGGIIGMGEKEGDRIGMLHTLATLPEHPESVPVNALVPVEGTPLEDQEKVSVWEMVRMIATARIIMPKAMVRLSAGRVRMTLEEQALCFMAGANSIFAGDKLLTTPNPGYVQDKEMFQILQLSPRPSHKENLAKIPVL
ncbi:biotin synthase [Chryseotalea sanaruensis]|jgi:biotin synthase|uniref:Biotin synthase n=1 Tax=Chryseotalea sanaruensis TaxID=2482724 RepID=A0A401UEP1_9BACT|nr:biotin synthase BioB [Chryseotalea sanaruensis]GCC53332.1 biotin synthase [Chryseotalea sanaruensis]